jgi:hypothetical protein
MRAIARPSRVVAFVAREISIDNLFFLANRIACASYFVLTQASLYQARPERLAAVTCCQIFGARLRDRLKRA